MNSTKIGVGAVQFGLDYGISNSDGITPIEEVRKILTFAKEQRLRVIDTAASYGISEEVLGKTFPQENDFDIVTKTPRFEGLDATSWAELLEQTFLRSLKNMHCSHLYGLLIHNADDLLGDEGELLIRKMKELKEKGVVTKIGVSVYSSEQIDRVLDRFNIDLIQLPINVLDQRLLMSGHLAKLKKEGIEVHARSAFLQGLLLMNPKSLSPYFDSVKPHLIYYHECLLQKGLTPVQAALSFVTGLDEVDVVICGVNNHLQLEDICGGLINLHQDKFSDFAIQDENILNPSKWKN